MDESLKWDISGTRRKCGSTVTLCRAGHTKDGPCKTTRTHDTHPSPLQDNAYTRHTPLPLTHTHTHVFFAHSHLFLPLYIYIYIYISHHLGAQLRGDARICVEEFGAVPVVEGCLLEMVPHPLRRPTRQRRSRRCRLLRRRVGGGALRKSSARGGEHGREVGRAVGREGEEERGAVLDPHAARRPCTRPSKRRPTGSATLQLQQQQRASCIARGVCRAVGRWLAEEEWAMRAQGHSPLRRARRPQPTRHQPRAQHRAEHRRKHKASSWCVSCTR